MALRVVAHRPNPAILNLPWSERLEDWGDEVVVPMPRGLSRHIVRIIRVGDELLAVKETEEPMALREYRLLRDLQRLQLPSVLPHAVIAGRTDADGEELPAALITRHLPFSLPYRVLFSHGVTLADLPSLVDAMVVLLVRLHLSGFYWGDVSLSNVLFRRDAGAFAAYLVDAETGELQPELSARMRTYDVTVGTENIFAEILDLQASNPAYSGIDPEDTVEMLLTRYDQLWSELTAEEVFDAEDLWRVEQRIERLNDLGFDVEELDIVTDFDGDTVRLIPRVVELGHHRRELQALTGLAVEDNQARRLLNDLASFSAAHDLGREERLLVANRWMTTIFDPIVAMIPAGARGKLEPAEVFHEILVHRWYLSERAGHEVDIFETARDYFDSVLAGKPDEAVATPEVEDLDAAPLLDTE
ncbi:MAG: DUF4032 domain-containing protein [Nocardioides sp.]